MWLCPQLLSNLLLFTDFWNICSRKFHYKYSILILRCCFWFCFSIGFQLNVDVLIVLSTSLQMLSCDFLKKICFYLKGRFMEGETVKCPSSTLSFPKWLLQPEPSRSEARRQKLLPGLANGCMVPRLLTILHSFTGPLARSWIENGPRGYKLTPIWNVSVCRQRISQ